MKTKKDNDKKVLILLNTISLVCGILALVLFFIEGVDFKDPSMWVIILIVLSSITSLIKLNLKPDIKKIKDK